MAAASEFAGKWLHREPEMGLVLRFIPVAQRASAVRWGALLSELRETAFELSDPAVTEAKLGWWAEELLRFGHDQPRHPLGQDLPQGLPWPDLATALVAVGADQGRPADPDAAIAQLAVFARAAARVECAWFGSPQDPQAEASLAIHLLAQRLLHGRGDDDAGRVPMNLLARHGLTPAALSGAQGECVVKDWAGVLHGRAPRPGPGMVVFRRLRSALDLEQLQHLHRHPGRGWRPGPLSVWRGWRLARAR